MYPLKKSLYCYTKWTEQAVTSTQHNATLSHQTRSGSSRFGAGKVYKKITRDPVYSVQNSSKRRSYDPHLQGGTDDWIFFRIELGYIGD